MAIEPFTTGAKVGMVSLMRRGLKLMFGGYRRRSFHSVGMVSLMRRGLKLFTISFFCCFIFKLEWYP